jgi:hypothetical protein
MPSPLQPAGRSSNNSDYQTAFLQRVHRLLQLGYESLTPADYQQAEEDDITGDLCKQMIFLTEVAPSEKWMSRFSVKDQDPSNDVASERTRLPRKGKRRPKIDIRIVCKHQTPNRGYCIEAKRLYRSDSVSKYVGDEGVGAFICGDYGKNDSFGGMLGYVQSGKTDDWLPKIETKLLTDASVNRSAGSKPLVPVKFAKGPKQCFTSTHNRFNGQMITLCHVMFLFRG